MIHYFLRDHACSPFMPEDESDTYKPIWVEEAERLRQKVEFEWEGVWVGNGGAR